MDAVQKSDHVGVVAGEREGGREGGREGWGGEDEITSYQYRDSLPPLPPSLPPSLPPPHRSCLSMYTSR